MLQDPVEQVSPPRIARGAGLAFSLPAVRALETPLNSISLPDSTTGTSLATFNTTAHVYATVNNFFDFRTPGAVYNAVQLQDGTC
jgi:hypothetical protein